MTLVGVKIEPTKSGGGERGERRSEAGEERWWVGQERSETEKVGWSWIGGDLEEWMKKRKKRVKTKVRKEQEKTLRRG